MLILPVVAQDQVYSEYRLLCLLGVHGFWLHVSSGTVNKAPLAIPIDGETLLVVDSPLAEVLPR